MLDGVAVLIGQAPDFATQLDARDCGAYKALHVCEPPCQRANLETPPEGQDHHYGRFATEVDLLTPGVYRNRICSTVLVAEGSLPDAPCRVAFFSLRSEVRLASCSHASCLRFGLPAGSDCAGSSVANDGRRLPLARKSC